MACAMLMAVPRVFLTMILKNCVALVKENDCALINEKGMRIFSDKRSKEKSAKKRCVEYRT